jgi:hypothetical protein
MDSPNEIPASAFDLSSRDHEDVPPCLSVWEMSCCSPQQALVLAPTERPFEFALVLVVAEVRSAHKIVSQVALKPLDVIWRNLFLPDQRTVDTRDGALGHCGIVELKRPPSMRKDHYKSLREELGRRSRRIPLT